MFHHQPRFRIHLLLCLCMVALTLIGTNSQQESSYVSRALQKTSTLVLGLGRKSPITTKHNKLSLLYISLVLLTNASDVEINPGPSPLQAVSEDVNIVHDPDNHSTSSVSEGISTVDLCGACKEKVTWSHKGLLCENCYTWHHADCQNVGDTSYARLGDHSSVVWLCHMCDASNYSSVLFDLHGIETENRFSSLEDSILSLDSVNSADFKVPKHSSSPVKPRPKRAFSGRPLRIINVNCQSLVNKRETFYNLLDSSRPDIVIATETWLKSEVGDSEFFSDNYNVYRRDRITTTTGGGIIIAINSEYISSVEEIVDTDNTELLWVKINITGARSLYVGACYRPRADDSATLDSLNNSLSRINCEKSIVLLGGDFNFPGWDWASSQLKPKSPCPSLHLKFGEMLNDYGLTQVVTEPTRSGNILDLLITNRPSQVNRVQILPGIGDHDIPYAELEVIPTRKKQVPRSIPLYRKANWGDLEQHMSEVGCNIRNSEDTASVEDLWSTFKQGYSEGLKKFIPHKNTKSKDSCPWISPDLRKLIRRRDRAYKASKSSGRTQDEVRFQKLKKSVQRGLRRAYWQYVESIVTPQEEDQDQFSSLKRFWTFIKHKKSTNSGIAPLKVNGKLITDSTEKAEALNNQFQSVFTQETDFHLQPPAKTAPTLPEIVITTEGVRKLLSKLKPGKASGPDNISPRVLKQLASVLADPLSRIFRKSLAEGCVPEDWRHANVAPIFKKGQHYVPANYRPISLTCVASKVMEHIICSSLMKHANNNGLFYHLQHGFRDRRSCETQLLEFIQDVVTNMQNGLQTDVCVLDFSKAFDKVGHRRLLEKLRWYGIKGQTNKWIESFLTDRTQAVVVEGKSSSKVPVLSGVPQGSVLGPCLFVYYINDIAEGLTSNTRLFADDTMIYLAVKNNSDAQLLQQDLHRLEDWEQRWMMEFHPKKCEVVSITRKRSPIIYPYTLHGHQLEHVPVIKYLGVSIASDFRWDHHINNLITKANRTLGFLRRNLNVSNPTIKEQAYFSLIRSVLEYGSTVWNPHTETLINKIEMVQRRAARFVLHRHHQTSSVGSMLEQLEWQSLAERRRAASLLMFYKIHYGHVATVMPSSITPKLSSNARIENSLAYNVPHSSRDYHRHSFFQRTVREWNILPECTVSASSPAAFKRALFSN